MGFIRQAALLVGGRGTRLGALTETGPKPLVDVAGRPFLDWLIEDVARFGFERITLLAGYKAEQIQARYDGRTIRGAMVEVLVEPEPLGTGGALAVFADRLDDTFLLLNGDTLFPINLLDLSQQSHGATATLALRRTAPGDRYGTVGIALDGVVTGFAPPQPGHRGPINGGIYALSRSIVDLIEPGRSVSLEAEIFPALVSSGRARGALYDAPFIDIGIPADLARAQSEIPAMVRRPAAFLDRDGVLIVDDGYPHDPAKIVWIAGAIEAVRRLNDAGFYVFIVTNQAGVARGRYAESQVHVVHRWMADGLARAGAHVDAFAYCPHHPEASVVEWRRDCRRRKPAPGMILDLAAEWPVDLSRSFLIGDKDSDLQAAQAAGIPSYLFTGGDLSRFVEERLRQLAPS